MPTRLRLPALLLIAGDELEGYPSVLRRSTVGRTRLTQPTGDTEGRVEVTYADGGLPDRFAFGDEVELYFGPDREAEVRAIIELRDQRPPAWVRYQRQCIARYLGRFSSEPSRPKWMNKQQARGARRAARAAILRHIDAVNAEDEARGRALRYPRLVRRLVR